MIGAIAGDVIGSVYERKQIKTKEFPLFSARSRFTDDTVLTVAVAWAILGGRSYHEAVLAWGQRYPDAGYGGSFRHWLVEVDPQPYNSWGNGSAMRVSPVGWLFETEEEVLSQAEASAIITHNHPEGVKGAQATALAVFLARKGCEKEALRERIQREFGYDLTRTVEGIRPGYRFDVSCQGSVPEAIIAFLDGDSYEDTVRNAISLGGDSDTLACIAGGIAEAYYGGVPSEIRREVESRLDEPMIAVLRAFEEHLGR